MSRYDEVPQGDTCLCCGGTLEGYEDPDLTGKNCTNRTCPLFLDDVVAGDMVDMYLMDKIRGLVKERDEALAKIEE